MTNADNVVRVGRGSAATSNTSTAIVVTLDSGSTDADSVLFVGLHGEGLTFATPSGWAVVQASSNGLTVFRRGPVEGLAAAESSWSFTPSATAGKAVVAGVVEVSNVDPATTVDVVGTVVLQTSGVGMVIFSSQVSTYDGLAVAFCCHRDSANATPATWGVYLASGATSIDPSEMLQQGQAGTGNSVDLAVVVASVQSIANYQLSTTISRTPLSGTAPGVGFMFVINAVGARHASDLFYISGAEHGTLVGNTLGPIGGRPFASVTAGVSISSIAARSGAWGWEFTSTAAACNFVSDTIALATTGVWPAFRFAFKVPDLTDRRLFEIKLTGTTTNATCSVRLVSGSLNVLINANAGSTQISDQAVTVDQWVGVDVRFDCRARPNYVVDWQVDYNAELTDTVPAVSQTQATFTGVSIGTALTYTVTAGSLVAVTATMYMDDIGGAPGHNFPIGDLRVLPLKVDPAGTPTISGTSTNFGVMTANGTVAAWNATNARNAVDDVPPDLSATRDAAVALLAHATDYAEFPMETYDLAANKVAARGVKFLSSVWAASATTATIRVFVYDGTTQYTVYAEADPNADNTATPVWICAVMKSGSTPTNWTQAAVGALTVRFGSNDATPDIGLDMMLLELAVVKAIPESLFGTVEDPVYVEASRDPATAALVGMTVTTQAGQDVTVDYEIDGTPGSTGVITGGSATYVPLSADGGVETVNKITLIPA